MKYHLQMCLFPAVSVSLSLIPVHIIQFFHSSDNPVASGLLMTSIFGITVSQASKPGLSLIKFVIGRASKPTRPDQRFRIGD